MKKRKTSPRESAKEFIQRKSKEFLDELKNDKLIKMKSINRRGKHCWLREKWTFMKQCNMNDKVFVVERLRRRKSEGRPLHRKRIGDIEYRIGYYRVGKNGRAKGKWIWGQFSPMIPRHELGRLIMKSKKEQTIR